ncbi:hypothetical protein [Streptomyces stelliscabiei]|uniref:Uncharacterized protein n=1 Tax=Streptomyces stelliscabiei TaxID=146820 RepID=A0A8I0P2Y0_9ACTN|nr:hypothetical protein [Streptomyces stelliscabiei]KND45364.1 hypothetical protein IQ64_07320 [Streptomyces stelliscabiei]MBE1597220.1 hypothetical protein [Streptomyces stelliscabiei]
MASTTARTRQSAAAKRNAAKTLNPDVDFEPVRIAADDEVVEERVPLFYIGDDEYTIPKRIPKGVALQYLRQAGERGHELATAPLLIRVLGEDAYEALEKSKALTDEQLESIVDIIVGQALGRQEGGKGKAQSG